MRTLDKPILRFYKKAESSQNKIVIPKIAVEKFGREFYLEVHEDKIILIPIKRN